MSLLMKRVGWSVELTITRDEVLSYRIHEDGHLTLVDQATHQGSGPHENQASPHVHYADLTPDKLLITCDLGTDQVVVYQVDDLGKLTEAQTYQTAPGAGPRHIIFILITRRLT